MYLGILKKGPAASLPTPWFTADSGSSMLSLSLQLLPFSSLPREVQGSNLFRLVTLGEALLSLGFRAPQMGSLLSEARKTAQ